MLSYLVGIFVFFYVFAFAFFTLILRLSVSDNVQSDHGWELHITVEFLCSQLFSDACCLELKFFAYSGCV